MEMLELFCTAKGIVVEVGDAIELPVFMLRNWQLEPGTRLEQRRGEEIVAVWVLIKQQPRSLMLKKLEGGSVEQADAFYVSPPPDPTPIEPVPFMPLARRSAPRVAEEVSQDAASSGGDTVLIFGGKNWKLASPKKWIPGNLVLDGFSAVGELVLGGKSYTVFKLTEGFAAQEKLVS